MTFKVDAHGHLHMLTHSDEYTTMEESIAFYDPREEVTSAIIAAYNDPCWDWTKCDGCTVVSECGYPKGFKFPVCVAHDHICWQSRRATTIHERERIRSYGDKILYWGHIDYGQRWRAPFRWVGVRVPWLVWGLWQTAE